MEILVNVGKEGVSKETDNCLSQALCGRIQNALDAYPNIVADYNAISWDKVLELTAQALSENNAVVLSRAYHGYFLTVFKDSFK